MKVVWVLGCVFKIIEILSKNGESKNLEQSIVIIDPMHDIPSVSSGVSIRRWFMIMT